MLRRHVISSHPPLCSVFTLFQRNVLIDSDGIARLGGLGSAFAISRPFHWSDLDTEGPFRGIVVELVDELIDPRTAGHVHPRTTKATDVFAVGSLAREVR